MRAIEKSVFCPKLKSQIGDVPLPQHEEFLARNSPRDAGTTQNRDYVPDDFFGQSDEAPK